MKPRFFFISLIALITISATSFFTYQVFSYYQDPEILGETNQAFTLVFPDQEYEITSRDLGSLDGELVIPQKDDSTPVISYDSTEGIVRSVASPYDYVVEVDYLKQLVSEIRDGESDLKPDYVLRERIGDSLAEYNLKLNKIYRTPLKITIKDGTTQSELSLDTHILRSILAPTSIQINIPPEVNRQKLIDHLTSRLSAKQAKYFDANVAYQSTRVAIHSRFIGEATPSVLGTDDGPTSQGELASKYLEVDLSQQKMYFFINGSLYKEYKVSTGAEYPTPVGEFHILNKATNAFSNIYKVWMPYWMGFSYAKDVGAYLGLHEIAYDLDAKGKPFYKHGYYIGDMMTGGCVAMEPKDSREIYNLSDVGMLVRIVK